MENPMIHGLGCATWCATGSKRGRVGHKYILSDSSPSKNTPMGDQFFLDKTDTAESQAEICHSTKEIGFQGEIST